MENRRQDYRHVFGPHLHRTAELTSHAAKRLHGEILDLSVTGMRLRINSHGAPPRPRERMRVQFELENGKPMALDAEVVYAQGDAEPLCGMRFLRLADVHANDARERRLWGFLLEEQFRKRRSRPAAPSTASHIASHT